MAVMIPIFINDFILRRKVSIFKEYCVIFAPIKTQKLILYE